MITTDQCGRILTCCTCGGIVGDVPIAPLIYNPDTGDHKYMLTRLENGVNTPFLTDPSPKVRDDDDGLWRYVYYKITNNVTEWYLSDTADEIPGYELIVKDINDGNLRRMRSRQENGIPTWYWEDL